MQSTGLSLTYEGAIFLNKLKCNLVSWSAVIYNHRPLTILHSYSFKIIGMVG
jgi:hypothetical protein